LERLARRRFDGRARNAHSANKRHMYTPFQFGTLRNGASFLGKSADEEPPMAREPDKSARETGQAKSEATAGSRSGGNDETAGAKSGAPETVEQLKTQHRDLQATLAKRSDIGADPSAL
jgi:hypothetical protein